MIKDNQTLKSAKSEFGHSIKVYDDGFGPLWLFSESLGVAGIVRAQTYESAWDCILDEILSPVPLEDVKASLEEYYVCERDYHCPAPKDYDKGLCSCSKTENSYMRECWKCRQLRTPDEKKACDCTEPKELGTVYLALAEGCHYMPNAGDSSGIVQEDLNGSFLKRLTLEQTEALKITLEIEDDD